MNEAAEQLADRLEAGNQRARNAAREFRLGLRSLLRARAFTLLAVVTLGLGIGACVALFALTEAVLWRGLPFPQPQRLVALLETSQRFPRIGLSWPDYLDWKASNRAFSQLAATRGTEMTLDHLGPATMVVGLRVTANYFDLLGIHPALGRTFTPAEDSAAGPDVVVLSNAFFRSHLGGNPGWLGRGLDLDGKLRTVVGVMPPGFPGTDAATASPQFWTPLGAYAAAEGQALISNRGSHSLLLLGRLRPGVTLAQARGNLATVTAALATAYPATDAGVSAALTPYRDFLTGTAATYLLPLLAAAALLLLVACASVANLLLARGAARAREAGIRLALGATPGALLRHYAAEGLWLGLGSCALGLVLAEAALRALPAAVLDQLPRGQHAALGPAVVAVACGLGLLASLVFTLAPHAQLRRSALADALRPGGRSLSPSGARARRALIISELALATLLLVGGGLLTQSVVRLNRVAVGFQPQGVLSYVVGLADPRFATVPQQQAFFHDAVERLARLPGVAAAGGAFPLPLIGYDNEIAFTLAGAPPAAAGHEPTAHHIAVRGDYFQAMGIALRRGRLFTSADRTGTPPVAVVDTVFAGRYLDGGNPVGCRVNLDGVVAEIVGEVAHVQDTALADQPAPQVYQPQDQAPGRVPALSFVVRAHSGSALALRSAAVAQITALDADQPVTDLAPMSARVAASTAPQRRSLQLVACFALLALAMALVGVYGLISYSVVQRTRELGICMALGAPRARILRAVLGEALRLAALGAAVGLLLSYWLARAAAGLLYGVTPRDPFTFVAVPLLLLATVAAACFAPAWRAACSDPLTALRAE